jgi:hypothetical protein
MEVYAVGRGINRAAFDGNLEEDYAHALGVAYFIACTENGWEPVDNDGQADRWRPAVLAILRRGEEDAERILKNNWPQVLQLGATLCEQAGGQLTGEQVRAIVAGTGA